MPAIRSMADSNSLGYLCMMVSAVVLLLLSGEALSDEAGGLPAGNAGLLSSTGLVMANASTGSLVGEAEGGEVAGLGLHACKVHSEGLTGCCHNMLCAGARMPRLRQLPKKKAAMHPIKLGSRPACAPPHPASGAALTAPP